MNRVRYTALALLALVMLAACTPLEPYRTTDAYEEGNKDALLCSPDQEGRVALPACQNSVVESSEHADLFLVEFTDQGLQYPSQTSPKNAKGHAPAAFQINRTLDGLNKIIENPNVAGISLVVFVHGWKHNAHHDDENLRNFRLLLQSAADMERARNSGYRVVGVYVGWRGLSIEPWGIQNLSFWSRKAAAMRVAQGSARELFSRLRAFQCGQNRSGPQTNGCGGPADTGHSKVRMMLIGHSFGGLALFNAVSGALVESLTHVYDSGGKSPNWRYGDMVVLINPAFEASRYTPLHRIATTSEYTRYQTPILVSVTSTGDWATGWAFPFGRRINTIFERYASDEERGASRRTMGHMRDYVTHDLNAIPGEEVEQDRKTADAQKTAGAAATIPPYCTEWKPLREVTDPAARSQQIQTNLEIERKNAAAFVVNSGRPILEGGASNQQPASWENGFSLAANWSRTFCGGSRLVHRQHHPMSVVWNVSVSPTILKDHNDISNPKLIDFIRQLYHDTFMVTSAQAPTTLSPEPAHRQVPELPGTSEHGKTSSAGAARRKD